MRLFSWNCQRLGRSHDLVIPRLKEIRNNYFPEILFLLETMHSRDVLVDIQAWLGYARVYTVEPIGKSGGLDLFCKKNVAVELCYVDKNLFDIVIQFESFKVYISCIYGDPMAANRPKLWKRITRIGVLHKESWCILGHFNDMLHNGEKIGGSLRSELTFISFGNMIRACEMTELHSSRNALTWGGNRNHNWIQSQLDRCFVLVNLLTSQNSYRGQFNFDCRFLHLTGIKQAITQAWSSPHPLSGASVCQRIRLCRKALSKLKKQNNLNSKTKDEESYWSQKSKEQWAKSGDHNTKFFHASVNANRMKKTSEKLVDIHGVEHRAEASKGMIAGAYFSTLFSSTNPSDFTEIFQGFQPRVTPSMNKDLTRSISVAEVREAKVKSYLMTDLRPISLCSILYKIIAKIIVHRLKPLMPMIIFPSQTAFVSYRLITDNIIVAHEMVHNLYTQPSISSNYMAIKSDMSKAFDRVKWAF
ncbi:hypothetical protein N665_0152s0020 [Sinapis alba]|nr:hypothetical protein N665_0152s0020 [Sinapis alba]